MAPTEPRRIPRDFSLLCLPSVGVREVRTYHQPPRLGHVRVSVEYLTGKVGMLIGHRSLCPLVLQIPSIPGAIRGPLVFGRESVGVMADTAMTQEEIERAMEDAG